jgi:hypothetical protein
MFSPEELDGIEVYFDLITFGGTMVRENFPSSSV